MLKTVAQNILHIAMCGMLCIMVYCMSGITVYSVPNNVANGMLDIVNLSLPDPVLWPPSTHQHYLNGLLGNCHWGLSPRAGVLQMAAGTAVVSANALRGMWNGMQIIQMTWWKRTQPACEMPCCAIFCV
jgi:hypothetical protein